MYKSHAAFRIPANEAEALAEQDRLRPTVAPHGPLLTPLRYVAGLDVAYAPDENRVAGAVVVLDIHTLEPVDEATAHRPVEFPYIPGLLAYREIPALLDALRKLKVTPDILVCDGYGLAHPRRFGLACHLGVLTDIPTFGVAKTPFIGTFTTPARDRGAVADLFAPDGTPASGDGHRDGAFPRPGHTSSSAYDSDPGGSSPVDSHQGSSSPADSERGSGSRHDSHHGTSFSYDSERGSSPSRDSDRSTGSLWDSDRSTGSLWDSDRSTSSLWDSDRGNNSHHDPNLTGRSPHLADGTIPPDLGLSTPASPPEIIGRVLRTQTGIKPVFISIGHRIGLDEATALTLRLAPSSPGFRLPETTRRSDQLSRQALAES